MNDQIKIDNIIWYKATNDINGNSRYICHFTSLIPDVDHNSGYPFSERYAIACKRGNKLGGRKYHCKAFGGGIIFQVMECELVELTYRLGQL